MTNRLESRGLTRRKTLPGYRQDVLEALVRLFVDRPEVTRGKMFGFPAFYTAGKLFACMYGEGVGLKLPEDMVRQLEGKPGITPFRPYGKPKMREWIHIRRDRVSGHTKHAGLFEESIAFVRKAEADGRGPRGAKRRARPALK